MRKYGPLPIVFLNISDIIQIKIFLWYASFANKILPDTTHYTLQINLKQSHSRSTVLFHQWSLAHCFSFWLTCKICKIWPIKLLNYLIKWFKSYSLLLMMTTTGCYRVYKWDHYSPFKHHYLTINFTCLNMTVLLVSFY